MAYQGSPSDATPGSHTWFPDIGVTNHATPDIATLYTYEEYVGNDTLCVRDCMPLSISRVSFSSFSTPSRSFTMSNILHVPGLYTALLSVQRFATENNVFFEFHPSLFFVANDITTKEFLLQGNSSGGLYTLTILSSSPSAFLTSRVSMLVRPLRTSSLACS